MEVHIDNKLYDFNHIKDPVAFEKPGFTNALYGAAIDDLWNRSIKGEIIDEKKKPIPVNLKIYEWCLFRLLKLQVELSRYFVGYDKLIQMLLACAIAQEPVLFVGRPAVAKTELALSFFSGVGLRKPEENRTPGPGDPADHNKYFEYLLSPFTVPEELFGTLDFKELELGTVTRINTNLATGKLVRGVFLDEIFNASSNILNTLLSLINERRYFDKGMFRNADLKIFIGATNMTPAGKYGDKSGMSGKISGELEAFYDRFTVRLYFPTPQEKHGGIHEVAEEYELIAKISSDRFMEKLTLEQPSWFKQIACINDILLLGRVLGKVDFPKDLVEKKNWLVASLAVDGSGGDLCHLSPRKPNKLLPVILADALLLDIEKMRQDYLRAGGNVKQFDERLTTRNLLTIIKKGYKKIRVKKENLRVFQHIWDFEGDRDRLAEEIDIFLEMEEYD